MVHSRGSSNDSGIVSTPATVIKVFDRGTLNLDGFSWQNEACWMSCGVDLDSYTVAVMGVGLWNPEATKSSEVLSSLT